MKKFTKHEVLVHEAGIELQAAKPRELGLSYQEITEKTGIGTGSAVEAVQALLRMRLAYRVKGRTHYSLRFRGQIPEEHYLIPSRKKYA